MNILKSLITILQKNKTEAVKQNKWKQSGI